MWTLIGSLADIRQPNAVNVYVKEKALAGIVEREAWRRRFSLSRFSNLAPEPESAPENVVYTEAEADVEAEAVSVLHEELMGPEEDIDDDADHDAEDDDDENDDEWSIL